jgi:hypothetical protein
MTGTSNLVQRRFDRLTELALAYAFAIVGRSSMSSGQCDCAAR